MMTFHLHLHQMCTELWILSTKLYFGFDIFVPLYIGWLDRTKRYGRCVLNKATLWILWILLYHHIGSNNDVDIFGDVQFTLSCLIIFYFDEDNYWRNIWIVRILLILIFIKIVRDTINWFQILVLKYANNQNLTKFRFIFFFFQFNIDFNPPTRDFEWISTRSFDSSFFSLGSF